MKTEKKTEVTKTAQIMALPQILNLQSTKSKFENILGRVYKVTK